MRLFATVEAILSNAEWLWTSSCAIVAGSLLFAVGCAGQFELDVPDEHPARPSARSAPIEPAPSPYDQRYPTAWDEDEVAGEPTQAPEPSMDRARQSETEPQ